MTDEELRRRLFRQHLGELALIAALVCLVAYGTWTLFGSVFQNGAIALNAGGRLGSRGAVVLKLSELPYGVVGVLMLCAAFAGLVTLLLASPAYHVIRTGIPQLKLPRVSRTRGLRRASLLYFGTMLLVASVGVGLVFVQYFSLGWS